MKKLSKLNINSEKLMKNEELVTLRGGYGDYCCFCWIGNTPKGYMLLATSSNCDELCVEAYPTGWGHWEC